MASKILAKMTNQVRDLIQDNLAPGYDVFSFINDRTFTMSSADVKESTLKVYVNKVQIINVSGNPQYTFDETTSRVTFLEGTGLTSLTCGDLIEFYYSSYKRFTDAEIRQYISSAIVRLSIEKYQTFVLAGDDSIYPTPVTQDGYLICFVASVLMEGNLARYRTPEIELEFGRDEDNESRIKRAIRQSAKTYGILNYANLRRPYTLYVEDSDMTLENLP